MPTSVYHNLIAICELISEVSPCSMLDIGVGNGRIGFLARDLLDVMHQPEQWTRRIDGIEIFPDYIQDHQRSIYDSIHLGNAREVIETLGCYDLVYIGDVLEHFEKEEGWAMLDQCALHASRFIGVAIPLGDGWEQEAVFGNIHEEHKAVWEREEFEPFASRQWLFNGPDGSGACRYGVFLIEPNEYRHFRARVIADELAAAARGEEAHALLLDISEEKCARGY